MTFETHYRQALSVSPTPPKHLPLQTFAGAFYDILPETAECFPTVLSGGIVELTPIYTLTYQPMDCRMLLYTREGSGIMLRGSKSYALEPGILLYMDCSTSPFVLKSAQPFWRFTHFMVQGDFFAQLDRLVPFESLLLHPLEIHSPVLSSLERLLSGSTAATLRNKLSDASVLSGVITYLFMDAFCPDVPNVRTAPYLMEIRHYLDTRFAEPFRLDDLEHRYRMSKYRICHEFSKAFGTPPLRYLNKRRLAAASNLLISTDKRIHEISLDVGFENTNHFINLFKRETGLTPQAYRDANRG